MLVVVLGVGEGEVDGDLVVDELLEFEGETGEDELGDEVDGADVVEGLLCGSVRGMGLLVQSL